MFLLFLHPLLVQRRQQASDAALAQYSLDSDLERRLIPRVLELVRSPEGHRICLGNWSTTQLDHLSSALLPTDSSAAIDAVLTTFSRQLVSRVDGIWEMRKQAKYLEAAAALPSADPGLLRYFQRKFKPYQPRPAYG